MSFELRPLRWDKKSSLVPGDLLCSTKPLTAIVSIQWTKLLSNLEYEWRIKENISNNNQNPDSSKSPRSLGHLVLMTENTDALLPYLHFILSVWAVSMHCYGWTYRLNSFTLRHGPLWRNPIASRAAGLMSLLMVLWALSLDTETRPNSQYHPVCKLWWKYKNQTKTT